MAISPLPGDEVKKYLQEKADYINSFLHAALNLLPDIPVRLLTAMKYSLNAGGKRIRPVLCMSIASACGLDQAKTGYFAAAMEMIHTYSLIHDDLPAMDNDDFRRGLPASHKQFDEATAILAGDALLTDAFYLALSSPVPYANLFAALRELAKAAGSQGMVGGQMLDMQYTGAMATLEDISAMQTRKTGALFTAACVCGALLAGAEAGIVAAYRKYGEALGRTFQITDDILDLTGDAQIMGKPVGSDLAAGKNTFPSLAGMEESMAMAKIEAQKAVRALPESQEAPFLAGLAEYLIIRSN